VIQGHRVCAAALSSVQVDSFDFEQLFLAGDDEAAQMSLPRPVVPNRACMITRRCAHRRFFLRPCKEFEQAFLFCLAVAAQRYGEEWAEKTSAAVSVEEKKAAELRTKTNSRIVGRKAILRQSPFSCPKTSTERRGLRPRVASRNKWRRIELLKANKSFPRSHRTCFRRCVPVLSLFERQGVIDDRLELTLLDGGLAERDAGMCAAARFTPHTLFRSRHGRE